MSMYVCSIRYKHKEKKNHLSVLSNKIYILPALNYLRKKNKRVVVCMYKNVCVEMSRKKLMAKIPRKYVAI